MCITFARFTYILIQIIVFIKVFIEVVGRGSEAHFQGGEHFNSIVYLFEGWVRQFMCTPK